MVVVVVVSGPDNKPRMGHASFHHASVSTTTMHDAEVRRAAEALAKQHIEARARGEHGGRRRFPQSLEGEIGAQLECTKNTGRIYCTHLAHPVKDSIQKQISEENHAVWEVFLPITIFARSARAFVHLNAERNRMIQTLQLLSVFGYVANAVMRPCKVPKEEVDENGKSKTVMECLQKGASDVVITWEMVMHKTDKSRVVGYRLRLIEKNHVEKTTDMLGHLVQLLEQNDERAHKRGATQAGTKRRMASDTPLDPTSHYNVTFAVWRQITALFCTKEALDALGSNTSSGNASQVRDLSEFNPAKVFSIDASLRQAERCDADARQCDMNKYIRSWGHAKGFTFPDPDRVWVISVSDLLPDNLPHLFLPHLLADLSDKKEDIARFSRQLGLDVKQGEMRYRRCIGASTASEARRNIQALEADIHSQVFQKRAELKLNGREIDERYFAWESEMQTKWIDEFFQRWSPQGDCPPSMQALSLAMAKWVEMHKTLSVERVQDASNLTRFGNWMAGCAAGIGSIAQVNTAHREVLLMLLMNWNVYWRNSMNGHTLSLGLPGIGKSMANLIVQLFMVVGTFKNLAYSSLKAYAADGNASALMILNFEDAPATMLGVQQGAKSKASDDASNILKQMMTSKEFQADVMETDPVRRTRQIKAETGCVFHICMNDVTDHIPDAIIHRVLLLLPSGVITPEDAMNLAMRMQREDNEHIKGAMSDLCSLFKRDHFLMAMVAYAMSARVISPIDMTVAETFWSLVAQETRRNGLDISTNPRHKKRYMYLCRTLGLRSGIDLALDAPNSPIYMKPWRKEYLRIVGKACSTAYQEVCVWVLTALKPNLEDDAMPMLLQTMQKHLFKDPKAGIDAYHQGVKRSDVVKAAERAKHVEKDPEVYNAFEKPRKRDDAYNGMEDESRYWMYLTCTFEVGGAIPPVAQSSLRSGKDDARTVLISHIVAKLQPHVTRQYNRLELVSRLRDLCERMVEWKRTVLDDDGEGATVETGQCPALVIENHLLRVAIPLIEYGAQSNVLVDAVKLVLCGLHTKDPDPVHTYVLGLPEDRADARHVWQTFTPSAHPWPADRNLDEVLTIQNPDFEDESTSRMACGLVGAANPAFFDPEFTSEVFNPQAVPWKTWDINLDKDASVNRALALGQSFDEQRTAPCTVPHADERFFHYYYRYFNAHVRGQPHMLTYPECVQKRFSDEFKTRWARMGRERPALFRASSAYEAALERQTKRPCLQSPSMVDTDVAESDADEEEEPQMDPPEPDENEDIPMEEEVPQEVKRERMPLAPLDVVNPWAPIVRRKQH